MRIREVQISPSLDDKDKETRVLTMCIHEHDSNSRACERTLFTFISLVYERPPELLIFYEQEI